MNSYVIAGFAESQPEDQRDRFARYALRTPIERVRNFVRYQMQMRRQKSRQAEARRLRRLKREAEQNPMSYSARCYARMVRE